MGNEWKENDQSCHRMINPRMMVQRSMITRAERNGLSPLLPCSLSLQLQTWFKCCLSRRYAPMTVRFCWVSCTIETGMSILVIAKLVSLLNPVDVLKLLQSLVSIIQSRKDAGKCFY